MAITNERRLALREQNLAAWDESTVASPEKLDSSIKKHTALIRKLKAVTAENEREILQDIAALRLEKYLGEISAALSETVTRTSKADDVSAVAEVALALHGRFLSIMPSVNSTLVNTILEGNTTLVSKTRNLFRVLIEFYLTGLCMGLDHCDGDSLPRRLNKKTCLVVALAEDLLAGDPEMESTLPVVSGVLKRHASFLFDTNNLVPQDAIVELKKILNLYMRNALLKLQSAHLRKSKLEKQNKAAAIRTGKVLEEYEVPLNEATALFEFLETHCSAIYESLGQKLPELSRPDEVVNEETKETKETKEPENEPKSLWHDAAEESFYRDIPSAEKIRGSFSPSKKFKNLQDGLRVNLFIQNLESANTEEQVSQNVADFLAYIPYNNATRHKLLKFFAESKKADNVNCLARFLKIVHDDLEDLTQELIELLDQGMRSQIHHGKLEFRKTAFFIELVKFKLISPHIVFHKIRRMTLNLASPGNVDLLTVFYERCGRFLLSDPEYEADTRSMLTLLRRQSKGGTLSLNSKLSLRNMFIIVDSLVTKSTSKSTIVEVDPMKDFVMQILSRLVTATKTSEALNLLTKIKFRASKEAQDGLFESYERPEELGQNRFESFATILSRLGSTQPFLVYEVLSRLFEKVLRGLETNEFKHNAARTSQMRFLAVLANHNIIDGKSIIDILYKVVCFGYPGNMPTPGAANPLDAPNDYFRVHLVSCLIKTLRPEKLKRQGCLNGQVKSLGGFMVFLLYYVNCKVQPIPRDIEYTLNDAFDRVHKVLKYVKHAPDLKNSVLKLQELTLTPASAIAEKKLTPDSKLSDSEDSSDELSDEDSILQFEPPTNQNNAEPGLGLEIESDLSSDSDTLGDDEDDEDDDDDIEAEEEQLRALELEQEMQKRFVLDMDQSIREMSAMAASTPKASKLPIPANFSQPADRSATKFTLITQSKQVHEISLPENNQFAERLTREQEKQAANRAKIISLLNMENA